MQNLEMHADLLMTPEKNKESCANSPKFTKVYMFHSIITEKCNTRFYKYYEHIP